MSEIALDRISYSFDDEIPIVDAVTWSVPKGAIHCLVGRSGCGKTTLLKLAAGLVPVKSGKVHVAGAAVHAPSSAVGFVFQSANLLEWLDVRRNVLLPLSLHRRIGPQAEAEAEALLERVGLCGLGQRFPRELSGGQQSRVAIARALIGHAAVLLMDEPFAALDAITREELQDDLLALCLERGTTVLFVTHDVAEAVYLGDRVAVMHEGRLRHRIDVPIAKPRAPGVRFTPEFNALCQQVHAAMRETVPSP